MSEEEDKLIKIGITQLIKFAESFKGIEVNVSVGGKFIKLNYSEDNFIEILRKLQQKEVNEVYINQTDCRRLITEAQSALSAKNFYDPKTVDEKRVEVLDETLKAVKSVINQLGVRAETVQLLKTVNERSMAILNESPSLYAFIKRFKKNCSEQFLHAMLTSYVMTMIIDKFPWRSDSVKEKGAMASMLCDMILEKEDFKIIKEWEKGGYLADLPDHIKYHPFEIAEKLRQKRSLIPSETITIIEQHHEMPDGRGFPQGINAAKFNQLSAIFIVSQNFVEHLFDSEFDFEKRHLIIERIQTKYQAKSFEKAIEALISVVA